MGALQELYDKQRTLRQEYPVGDALLNFVPFVGAAASADDVAHNLYDGDYGEALLNAVGFLPGGKLIKAGFRGVPGGLASAIGRMLVHNGKAYKVPSTLNAADAMTQAGTMGGLTAYELYILQKQAEANERSK